jgi:FtsZ-interacting cell division protein ZipA
MSTLAVILIIIAALVVLFLVFRMANRQREHKQQARLQMDAKRDDVVHHREQAADSRAEAQVAAERARRQATEAELHEERAARREDEVEEER